MVAILRVLEGRERRVQLVVVPRLGRDLFGDELRCRNSGPATVSRRRFSAFNTAARMRQVLMPDDAEQHVHGRADAGCCFSTRGICRRMRIGSDSSSSTSESVPADLRAERRPAPRSRRRAAADCRARGSGGTGSARFLSIPAARTAARATSGSGSSSSR